MRLMVHLALAAVVTAGTATVAHAQGAATRQADVHPNANTEDEIKALEKKFADLIVHDGWDEYEKRLAPEYTRTGSDGKLEKKEDAMAGFRKGPRKVIVMEPEELRVQVYTDTAVLQGMETIWVRELGRVSTKHERFMKVFVRRDGEWYLATEQATATGK